MLRRLSTLVLLTLLPALAPCASASPGDCPGSAADRPYRPLVFRSAEARDRHGVDHDLLGVFAPNPLCYLNDIATRAAGHAVKGEGHALRGIYTLSAHACLADARAGDPATHEMVCELPRIVSLFQAPADGTPRLLRELGLQNAFKRTAAWIQTRPHRSAYMDARAPVAAAELWSDRPVQATHALFTTFTCGGDHEALRLDTCRLQKDVLAQALKQAIDPVLDKATRALEAVRRSRQTEHASVKSVLFIEDASSEIVRLLGQDLSFVELMSSRLPELIDRHLKRASVPEGDPLTRAAVQATEELANLVKLGTEVAEYTTTYPAISAAQFSRVSSSPEMAIFTHAVTDRASTLADMLAEYLRGRLRLSSAPTLVP